MIKFLSSIGAIVRLTLVAVGLSWKLLVRLIKLFRPTMRRFSLVSEQMHFLGN